MSNDIIGWGIDNNLPAPEKCEVCGDTVVEGEATCGAKYCRETYWEITPAEIYLDLFFGVE